MWKPMTDPHFRVFASPGLLYIHFDFRKATPPHCSVLDFVIPWTSSHVKSSSPGLYVFRINTNHLSLPWSFFHFTCFLTLWNHYCLPLTLQFFPCLSGPFWDFFFILLDFDPKNNTSTTTTTIIIIIISFYCLPLVLFPHCRHLAHHQSGMNTGVQVLYSCTWNATGATPDSCLFSQGSYKCYVLLPLPSLHL